MLPRWFLALTLAAACLAGCEERERQDREYTSDPAELRQALAQARGKAERLEVLDLLAAVEDRDLADHPELFDAVRPILADADPIIAAKAGDVLARWGDAQVLAPLVAMLRDSDPWVRLSAAASLALLDRVEAVADVAEATLDREVNVRAQACRTVGALRVRLNGRPLELLRARLHDEFASVRAAAAYALGYAGNDGDYEELRAALRDPSEGVVVEATTALGRLRDRGAIPELLEILDSGDQATRVAAADALGRIDDRAVVPALIAQLRYPDTIVRGAVMRALSDLGDERAMVPLLAMAVDDDPLLQTFVPFVVGRLYRPHHFELLRGRLDDPLPEVRNAAAFAFGVASEHRAVPLLRERLGDPDHRVRMAALGALGLLGAKEAEGEIEHAVRYDPDAQVRDAAKIALAMARIEAPSLVSRLIQGLASDVSAVRLASATLLTAIREERAVAALRLRLDDEEELIRNAARAGIKHILGD
jgi:HEAT repeat protein